MAKRVVVPTIKNEDGELDELMFPAENIDGLLFETDEDGLVYQKNIEE